MYLYVLHYLTAPPVMVIADFQKPVLSLLLFPHFHISDLALIRFVL